MSEERARRWITAGGENAKCAIDLIGQFDGPKRIPHEAAATLALAQATLAQASALLAIAEVLMAGRERGGG